MIPITENTITAIAALIYNHAYNQDPDSGWTAEDERSAPGNPADWLEWSSCLLQVLEAEPTAEDEQVIALAASRVDTSKAGYSWNTIWMQQTESGDEYSTMTEETSVAMPLVRDFLEEAWKYPEVAFLENDPVYLAYMNAPVDPLAEYEHRQRGETYQNEKDQREAIRDMQAGG